MEWSRIKTILIWVFALVNLFLLTIYFKEANTGKVLSDEVLVSTVEILKQNNISIEKDIIPKNFQNVKVCSVENRYADVEKMLTEAGVDKNKYTTDGNGFLYTAQSEEEAEAVLKKLLLSSYKKEEAYGVEFYYLSFGNKVFFDSYVWVKNTDGTAEIGGKNWLGDSISEEGVAEIVSPAEILVDFSAQYDGSREFAITGMTEGYYIGERAENVRATAAPVWRITLSNGEEVYLDMRNGDIL